jgi:hypothetical protein
MSDEIKIEPPKEKSANDLNAEIAAKKKADKAAAVAALAQKREARVKEIESLKANVGGKFDGGVIVGFYPEKELGGKIADAYLVNYGNPYRNDFIHVETFNAKYKLNQ